MHVRHVVSCRSPRSAARGLDGCPFFEHISGCHRIAPVAKMQRCLTTESKHSLEGEIPTRGTRAVDIPALYLWFQVYARYISMFWICSSCSNNSQRKYIFAFQLSSRRRSRLNWKFKHFYMSKNCACFFSLGDLV